MIRLGLTSYSEHESLIGKSRGTLYEYASHLPLLELDTAYYGIPKKETVCRWVRTVPEIFRFVVKVYGGISGQHAWHLYYQSQEEMIQLFLKTMQPLVRSGKLFTFLIQFPSTFVCNKENISYLLQLRQWFAHLPVAIELRNQSWYTEKYLKKTLAFMRTYAFSLTIVDEPQIPNHSVPFFPFVTNQAVTLFRLHGRNVAGWKANDADWRKKRTLYRYSTPELAELSQSVKKIANESKEVAVIFNNNSGGDAAGNLLEMKQWLQLEYTQLHPKQMKLF